LIDIFITKIVIYPLPTTGVTVIPVCYSYYANASSSESRRKPGNFTTIFRFHETVKDRFSRRVF